MNELLSSALQYAWRGWRVVPLHSPAGDRCSCDDPQCDHIGKHPRIKGWQARASIDERVIREWWRQWPDANVGIATGPGSGLLVVDRDAGELPHDMPAGPVVLTAQGEHYYLQDPGVPVINAVDVEGYDFDIRTDGGLVVAPPSIHASGHKYEWYTPANLALPAAPEWLIAMIAAPAPEPAPGTLPNPTQGGAGGDTSPYVLAAVEKELAKLANVPQGRRNDQLNRSAFALGTLVGGGELAEETIADQLYEAGIATGLPADEVRSTVRSGLRAGMLRPRTIAPPMAPKERRPGPAAADSPPTWTPEDYISDAPAQLSDKFVIACLNEEEYGDAKLLARLYAGRLVYDHAEKQWYVWSGQNWYLDRCGMIRHLIAGQVARQYLHLAAELAPKADDDSALKKIMDRLLARATALRRLSRCNNVREFATSLMGITGEEWDRDPWLLGVANGVLDLRTGKLREGRPEDYIRCASGTIWRGIQEPAPRFEQFISEIFDGDAEIAAFVQRLLGYAITGLTVEHVFPVFYGEKGRNGKDTLLETLKRVLGDVADAVSTDVLMAPSAKGQAQPYLIDLMGRRLVWASETAAGARLNEAQVKLITGGGTIKTRQLYGRMIEFQPTHTVLLLTNFKPKVSADDPALWNRMALIPFTLRFVDRPEAADERQRDPHLVKKLTEERSGILAWLMRGCLEWQQRGSLATPDKIRAATQQYHEEEDTLGQFLADRCAIHQAARVPATQLYQTYKEWADEGGMQALNQMNFSKRMQKRFERKRTEAAFIYLGVGLLAQTPDPLIPPDPFFKESVHESESNSKNPKRGSEGIRGSGYPPPPGQGDGGMAEEGRAGEGHINGAAPAATALPAKHSVAARMDWLTQARSLLRLKGTAAELATDLASMSTDKLIEFCAWMEARA